MVRAGKGTYAVAAIVAVIVLITIIPMFHMSELHSDSDRTAALAIAARRNKNEDDDVQPGEFEPIVDPSLTDASENPTLAAAAACRMMDIIYRRESPNKFYTPQYARRVRETGELKGDNIYSHITRWRDPRKDKVPAVVPPAITAAGAADNNDLADDKKKKASSSSSSSSSPQGVTVFCMMYTEGGGDATQHLIASWLNQCDDYMVVSRFATPPPGVDLKKYHEVHVVHDTKPDSMFPRISQTLHMLALTKASKFDYFIYTTDDSHVLIENLRMALNEPSVDTLHRMGAPLFIGHRMVTGDDSAFISSALMIMNTYLMKLFITILPDTRCFVTHQGGSEDLFLSKCLNAFRIFPLSIEDVFGQERLHIFNIDGVAGGGGGGWYNDYHRNFAIPRGLQAFSPSTFHIHYVDGKTNAMMAKAFH